MRKHQVSMVKYGVVFVITIFVFLFGVLLGNYFTMQKFANINEIETEMSVQTQGAELQYMLLLQEPCKYSNSSALVDDLYRLSERLDYMEAQRGEDDPDVQRLKNTYSILELRHWMFVLKTNEQCGTNQVPILYFYGNKKDCPKCEEQGYTLTYLRRKYPDLRVYSFDVRTDNPALDTIKTMQGITINNTPAIVLPHGKLNFTTSEELERELQMYGLYAGNGQSP